MCCPCATSTLFGQATWRWQNPLPQGNRLNAIHVLDATDAIGVGAGGTVMKTTDAGASWMAQQYAGGTLNDLRGLFFLDVLTGIAVGENGTILRTTDAGVTWALHLSGTVRDLNGVHFSDSNVGTAVGDTGTVIRTTDGGITWVVQASGTSNTLYSVFFLSGDAGTAVGKFGTIIRTTNGGVTWAVPASGTARDLNSVCFYANGVGCAVGDTGTVVLTPDSGVSWTAEPSGTLANFNTVSFFDATTWTVVGNAGTILRTTNAGGTWATQTSGLTASLRSVGFSDINTGIAVGNFGVIVRTSNAGASWVQQTSAVTTNNLRGVFLLDTNLGFATGEFGTILRTTDGGITWTIQPSGTTEYLRDVFMSSASTGTVVGSLGTILRTTTGGVTWTPQSSGTTNSLRGVYFTSPTTGTIVGSAGVILRTTNGGANWNPVSGTANSLRDVFFANPTTGNAVGSLGTILRTVDGGMNWSPQPSGTTRDLYAVHFSDMNTGTAVGDTGTILCTTNGGLSWMAQVSGTIKDLRAVAFTSLATGFVVGIDGRMLYTTDGGTNWTRLLSNSANSLLGVSFVDASTGMAVGSDGTILRTSGVSSPVPPVPALSTPSNGATNQPTTLSLGWNASSGATSYRLQLSTDSLFGTTVVDDSTLTGTSTPMSGLTGSTLYYWHVRAKNVTGTSGWSPAWDFTTSNQASINVSLASGWNLISNPVTNPVPGDSVRQMYPTSVNPYAFEFSSGYVQKYRLANRKGYWEKFPGAISNPIAGTPRTRDSVTVAAGWNIVGTISNSVDTSTILSVPPGLRGSNWFGYSLGYNPVAQLVPGFGYWVKANAAGKFVLATGPILAKSALRAENPLNALNSLTITDSKGGSQTLYFGAEENKSIQVGQYDMPPSPPVGAFDARFETAEGGSMVQTHSAKVSEGVEFPVTIQSDAYPVTITWRANKGTALYELMDRVGGRMLAAKAMNGEGSIIITNSSLTKFSVKLAWDGQLPKEFALSQNYPNPFNPTTSIKYALPKSSHVALRIHNLLGQEVRTLVEDFQEAGYRSAEWNATNNFGQTVGTGVYFYRMEAGEFVQTRKMLLLR